MLNFLFLHYCDENQISQKNWLKIQNMNTKSIKINLGCLLDEGKKKPNRLGKHIN